MESSIILRMISYRHPNHWIRHDFTEIAQDLLAAKAAVIALSALPYQKSWGDKLQKIQLKREVAGTSKIEGADFADLELDAALSEPPQDLETRSQRQAAAAVKAYRWIADLPQGCSVDGELVRTIHKKIVTDADDDHCAPGRLRERDQNVTLGIPPHRGANGGDDCKAAFNGLSEAASKEFGNHDRLVRALAFHYHLAAMHPFLDGNGRTARAVEALMLQRAGLGPTLFIAMSNYYYEEKNTYLETLAAVRKQGHDLTPFLKFGLKGIEIQCSRLSKEITTNVKKVLYRDTMYNLFNRLRGPRKRVLAVRQMGILKLLLESDRTLREIFSLIAAQYSELKIPSDAIIRDLNYLIGIGAINFEEHENYGSIRVFVELDWPTAVTKIEFFETTKKLPKAKSYRFLS